MWYDSREWRTTRTKKDVKTGIFCYRGEARAEVVWSCRKNGIENDYEIHTKPDWTVKDWEEDQESNVEMESQGTKHCRGWKDMHGTEWAAMMWSIHHWDLRSQVMWSSCDEPLEDRLGPGCGRILVVTDFLNISNILIFVKIHQYNMYEYVGNKMKCPSLLSLMTKINSWKVLSFVCLKYYL